MNRPERQRAHVLEKIDEKQTRTPGKAGKRLKRWRKWAEKYKDGMPAVGAATPS